METIKNLLLSNTLYAVVTLVLAELALAAVWYEKRTPRRLALLLIPPLLAGLLGLLAAFVTTDRDRIFAAADRIAADIQADRSDALEEYLDPAFLGTYNGLSLTKAGAIAASRAEKRRFRVSEIRIASPTIEIHGRAADMVAPTQMKFDSEVGVFHANVTFRLRWVKQPSGWRLVRADEPQIQR